MKRRVCFGIEDETAKTAGNNNKGLAGNKSSKGVASSPGRVQIKIEDATVNMRVVPLGQSETMPEKQKKEGKIVEVHKVPPQGMGFTQGVMSTTGMANSNTNGENWRPYVVVQWKENKMQNTNNTNSSISNTRPNISIKTKGKKSKDGGGVLLTAAAIDPNQMFNSMFANASAVAANRPNPPENNKSVSTNAVNNINGISNNLTDTNATTSANNVNNQNSIKNREIIYASSDSNSDSAASCRVIGAGTAAKFLCYIDVFVVVFTSTKNLAPVVRTR